MPTWDYQNHLRITAKDIAEAIRFRKDKGGFAKALRQVRHWTDAGLLQTITALDTGRGVAREYVDIPTISIAAVLQELTLYGLTVESLKPIADKLYDDYENGDPEWVHAAFETLDIASFLIVELAVDERGRLSVDKVEGWADHPDFDPFDVNMPKASGNILLNILAIAQRIEWPGLPPDEAEDKRGSRT